MTSTEQKRNWRISKRLKLTRASATPKLSQSELARRVQAKGVADFTGSHASRLELGYADATWCEVEAIAAALGVRPEWLAEIEIPATQPVGMQAAKPQAAVNPAPAVTPVLMPVAPVAATAAVASAPTTPPAVSPPPPDPAPPPRVEPPPPFLVPPQGTISIYEYRTLLGTERRKADETMGQKGLSPADWRRWRDYSLALTDTLRTLQI